LPFVRFAPRGIDPPGLGAGPVTGEKLPGRLSDGALVDKG
jgi:hypothetical protein